MQCSLCGVQLPMEVAYCPSCGAATPYHASRSEISPFDMTAVSTSEASTQASEASTQASLLSTQPASLSSQTPQTPPPPPQYGTSYGEVSQQNSYVPFDPYFAPPTVPSPPRPRRRASKKVFWISLISFVVSIIVIILFVSINDNFPGVDAQNTALDVDTFTKYYPPFISIICIILAYLSLLLLFVSPIVSVVSGFIWVISKFGERSRG